MRTLTIADNWKDWKFGDTDAVMTFTALDDDKVPDFSNRTLTFKIASTLNNDLEHPKDFAATATGYIQDKNVILKTEDVKQLTPGNYIVELWAMSNDTQKDAVYPSKGFAQFTIEENSMKVSDVTNIPSMTINAFWNAVMQKVRTLTKGAKGDPGKTPKIVIGSVTKLSPDAQPSATLVPLQSDPNTYTLNLQLPQGAQGIQGIQGIPGVGSKGLDGNNGLTPTIDPKTKHWMIGGTDTGVIAEGQAGKDADPSKYVTIVSFNQLRQQVQDNATALDALQKAGKSELEDKLAQMNLQPEMYADLEAVKAAYPNGATKLIATDDGYLALYRNGQWIKGPVFQAVGLTEDQNNRIMGIYQESINITTQTVAGSEISPAYGISLGRHWLFIQASDENVRKRAGELSYPQPVTDEQGVFTYTRSADSQQFSQTWITADHIYIRQLHDQVWSDWQVYQPYKVDADRNLLNGKVGATTGDSVVTQVQFMGHNWSQLTATGTYSGRGIEWFVTGDGELSQFLNKSTLFSTDIFPMFTQTLTLAVNFYDAAGNNLNKSVDIDKINLVANQPIHYQGLISIDSKLATGVAKVGISIQTRSTADIGKTLFGATELTSNFDSYSNSAGLLTTPAIVLSGDQNTSMSDTVFVSEIWHKLSLTNNAGANQGLMWKVMDNNAIYMLFHGRGRFSFDIFPYVTLTATVNVHFYDYFGNDLNKTVTIDTVNFQAGQMKHYDHVFTLEESLADGVVQVGISIEAVNSSDNASLLVRGEKLLIEYSSEDDALNTPASDLPAVYLSGDVNTMTKDNKVPMNFVFKDRTRTIVGYSATKWQGDSSLGYAKKAYRIQTFSDSAMKNKLKFKPKVDWAEGNKWNLKAYFTDALLCRDVVNANVGADIWANADQVPNTLIKADNYGFIDGFPVKLYLNGDFAGIYSFNIAKGDYGSDVQAIVGSVQAGAAQFLSLPDGGVKLDGKADYEMIYPDDPTDEIKTSLNNLINFVATSTDEDFKAQFEQYFDKTSVIDYLIFCNIIEDTDAWIKNQTLFTIDGKKWYYHPYDLDMSLGSGSDGAVFNPTKGIIGLDTNRLFKRVATTFGDDVKARYKDLRTWLTPAYILNRYRQHMNKIGVANYQAEEHVWHDSTVAFANYTVLKSHVYNRFKELDKVWLS